MAESLLPASHLQQPSRMPAVTNQPSTLSRLSPISNPTTGADPTTIQPTSLKPEESASTESEAERTNSQQPSLMPVTYQPTHKRPLSSTPVSATKKPDTLKPAMKTPNIPEELADNMSTSLNVLNHDNNDVAGDLVVNHALDSTAAEKSAPKSKYYYLWCLAFSVGLVLVSVTVFYTCRHQMIRKRKDDKVSTSFNCSGTAFPGCVVCLRS